MKRIVFAGGGTAGHITPNLALIEELGDRYECCYIGGDGMEKSMCEARGIPFYTIKTVKLRRDSVVKNAAVPFRLMACVSSAKRALREIRPDLIFSKGGYAALPAVLAAGRIPVIAHESDLTPGLVTKLSRRRAKHVLCAFEPCAAATGGIYTGTPLSQRLYRGDAGRAPGFADSKPVLLVMGGSSGAAAINAAVADAIRCGLTARFNVIHLTGRGKAGAGSAHGYCAMEFCDRMPDLYAACDAVVTRAGAGALAELVALNKPTVCVPLERASRGDQLQNAAYYAQRGAVRVVRESELDGARLVAEAEAAYRDRQALAAAMSRLSVDGTRKICDIIVGTLATAAHAGAKTRQR